jgi:GAF domain-containing protein
MSNVEELYYPGLYEAALALSSARSPGEIIRNLVERVAATLGTKGCSLMLLSQDKKHLIHTIAYGLSDRYIKKGPVLADRSISEALEGKIVAVLKAVEDERIQYREQAKYEGIASILSVPMKLRDEIIGVIRVYTAEQCQFNEENTYFVSAVASLSAIALENARLYKSIQRDYEMLKQELIEYQYLLT